MCQTEQVEVTEADLKYARQLLQSWSRSQPAGPPEENMARAVAEGLAYSRQQGLELAKAEIEL